MSRIVATIDRWANKAFTSKYNPFYYLGQLSVFFLVLLLISGIYILLFYKINVEHAYEAVEHLTVDQWYLGGIMRSIHRYASDGLIITLILHGIRLLFTGKFRFNRWLIWVSGVVLFGFVLLEGITGYWMVWDERAQLVAITTAEFFDSIPLFPKPLARAFINEASVTNLLFFAVIFVHVGGPLILMALILLHFSRFTRTLLLPPRKLWAVIVLILLAMALVKPAVSAPPADLSKAPVDVPVDWFYMFLLPLMHSPYGIYSWMLLLLAAVAFIVPPWLKWGRQITTAEVLEERCIGCELCYADCPYGAITMNKREGRSVAYVATGRCSGCGTCVGSCNFNAINLGSANLDRLQSDISRLIHAEGKGSVLAIVCEHSLNIGRLVDRNGKFKGRGMEGFRGLVLPCLGMVNPSLISHALNEGAAGVFLGGCKIRDCHYRLGNKWLMERLKGARAPVLKDKRHDRVKLFLTSPAEEDLFLKELQSFKEGLLKDMKKDKPQVGTPAPIVEKDKVKISAVPLAVIMLILPTLLIGYFSDSPTYSIIDKNDSMLLFTMNHKGERVIPCVEPTIEELKAKNFTECERERVPVIVELKVDGVKVLSKTYRPRGIRRDGPSYAYEKITIPPGEHRISIRIRDSREERFDYFFNKDIMFNAGRIVIIDFEDRKFTLQ